MNEHEVGHDSDLASADVNFHVTTPMDVHATAPGVQSHQGEPEVEGSGDRQVDEVMLRLRDVAALPVGEQVAEFESAHRMLQDALAAIDEA